MRRFRLVSLTSCISSKNYGESSCDHVRDLLHPTPPPAPPLATAFPVPLPLISTKNLLIPSHPDLFPPVFQQGPAKMAPVVESFPVSELATRAQYIANGKRRKPPVDLKDCELKEMLAFNCDLNGPQSDVRSRIKCESIMRTFRV